MYSIIGLILFALPAIRAEILLNVSDFEGATKSWAFVDKTPLLRDFFEGLEFHNLIACPKGFGKSVNLDMIKRFAEIVVNEKGELVDRKTTDNYKLFTSYELDLAISKDRAFIDQHLGMYPVLYVTFNDTNARTYTEALQSICTAIKRAFVQHKWLLSTFDEVNYESEIELFNDVLSDRLKDEKEILKSVELLCRLIEGHFHRSILLLIDEYDAPMMRTLEAGGSVRKIHPFVDKLYASLLVKSAYVGRVLLSGTFIVARAEASSKVDNLITWPFLDEHKYTHFCGFTREQLHTVTDKLNVTYKDALSVSQVRQIDKRYNSYNTRSHMTPIYNPYDITHYLATRKLSNYWIKHTSIYGHEAFYKIPTIKQKLLKLLWNKEVEFQPLYNVTVKDLEDHMKIGRGELTAVKQRHINLFFTYLLENGFLSYTLVDNVFEVPNSDGENELILRYHETA